MTRSIAIGIVGAGFIAESHAAAIDALPGCRLSTVFDVQPSAASAVAIRHGADTADSLAGLLSRPDIDAVIVGTPNDTHAEIARLVAAAGKHLLMEKPLALSAALARELAGEFDRRGLTLMAGHTHRHSDYARTIKALLDDGAVGTPRSMRIAITGGWIWGGWNSWVLDPARSGGHAFHNGVHLYDLARWWLGSPLTTAWGSGQRRTSAALAIDDYLVATFRTASGAAAVCEISRGERPRSTNVFEIVIHGTTGSIVRTWHSDGLVLFSDEAAGPQPVPGNSPFTAQLLAFLSAIRDGVPVVPSVADAIHALDAAEAVERSVRSGAVEKVAA